MKKLFHIIVISIFTLLVLPKITLAVTVDELKLKQSEINRRIDDINAQIRKDNDTQNELSTQIKEYDNLIARISLDIEQKQNSLDITKVQLNELNKQIEDLQINIQSLKERINELKAKADQNTFAMFKLDRQSTVSLVATKSIKDVFISKAIENNARHQTKAIYDELDYSRLIVEVKQSEVATSVVNQQNLLKQIEVEQQQLIDSQNGLIQTKANKSFQIAALQQSITNKLDTKTELGKQAAQIQADLTQFQLNIGNGGTRPNGTRVKRGDMIGKEGNTGLVCLYDKNRGYSNDICRGFGEGNFLASSIPCAGSHVHFIYENGGVVNPIPYINNGTIGKPLAYYQVTQIFGINEKFYGNGGHPAVDISQYCGAPVLAAQDGIVTYGVDQYGGKYAIIFGDDGTKTKYWHLQK